MKRIISLITTFAMIMTLFAGIGPVSADDSGIITGHAEYIEFGSYPQTEIVGKASQCGIYGKFGDASGNASGNASGSITEECGYEVNQMLYSILQEDTDWNNNDKVISGVKYHRIKKGDATYIGSSSSNYYKWSNSTTYHYFRYDPIKWRVLEKGGDEAFLLSEVALDDQKYNLEGTDITWEKSTVRSWLNGYGSSVNSYGEDYTSGNFIDMAFTEEEQNAILNTEVKNDDNQKYETNGGNDTVDKVFLLSESEVYGSDAVKYGFVSDCETVDKARQAKSSTYAKAMGAYSDDYSKYLGNCWWWLRSPGYDRNESAFVNLEGDVNYYGDVVNGDNNAIRPALNLNLKSINLYSIKYRDVKVKASDVTLSDDNYYYDGTAMTPDVTVSGLVKDTDYTVEYVNNVNPGTAKVIVKGIGGYSGAIAKEFEITVPSYTSGYLDREVSYELIEFGSYPQTEIVYEKELCGTYGKEWGTSSDYIVDSNLYSALMAADFDSNDDAVVGGTKYHRIMLEDATDYDDYEDSYNWSDGITYHYFRYDPITWRVLKKDGDDAFLLSDIALDCQEYNLSYTSVSWENSTLRSWLNGYGSSINKSKKDYSNNNFIDSAFTEEEQTAIIDTVVKNGNNYYGVNEGNDTIDKVFLLSELQVCGIDAVEYGFAYDSDDDDEARASKSSTYAKAMGVWSECYSGYLGNCDWWLSYPIWSKCANYVSITGSVGEEGTSVDSGGNAIRPALHLNLKSTNLYSKAGSTGVISTQEINDFNMGSDAYPLNGDGVTPRVWINGLTEGADYTVSYENNDKIGIATVVVKGIGKCSGTLKKSFAIVDKIDISEMKITMPNGTVEYTGKPCCPEVKVENLVKGEAYAVTYENNNRVGLAKVIVSGITKNGYTGTIEKTFVISKANISKKTISIPSSSYLYTGAEITPVVTIDGLKQGTDYTVSYSNNVGVGIATITVKGIGNCESTLTKTFTIEKAKAQVPLAKSGLIYDGNEKTGVSAGTGYTITGNTGKAAGKYTAVAKLNENYMWSDGTTDSKNIEWVIEKKEIDKPSAISNLEYNGSLQTGVKSGSGYTITGNTGKAAGSYTAVAKLDSNYTWSDGTDDDKEIKWSIAAVNISSKTAKLSKTSYKYSGKANKPSVTIKGLKSGKDYKVKYSSNVKCGKAKVTITGTGNYKGSITKYFNITPAKAAISKAVAGKKKITVTIKSQKASGVTGYEISYKKAGSKAKVVTTTSTSKALTGLVKGKKYTVKVRAYKTIGGKKVYGAYSAAKTVKVK